MQRSKGEIKSYRPPFWLPAVNYYMMAVAVTIAFFFLLWGILHDGGVDTPFIPAGLGASIVLGSAVVLREIILRSARNRYIAYQRLDESLKSVARTTARRNDSGKLTLERNAAILRVIAKKSEAAKILGRFAEGHREVFDMCEEYLAATARELPTVGVGSPRIAALRRGNAIVGKYHHFHLLQWAEIESRSLTQNFRTRDKISDKLASAQQALGVIDFALGYYPHDSSLLESANVLKELIVSIKIKGVIEKAERAELKGNYNRAASLYREALFQLQNAQASPEDDNTAAEKIRDAIVRIEQRSDRS